MGYWQAPPAQPQSYLVVITHGSAINETATLTVMHLPMTCSSLAWGHQFGQADRITVDLPTKP
jgi:hypothetical protein